MTMMGVSNLMILILFASYFLILNNSNNESSEEESNSFFNSQSVNFSFLALVALNFIIGITYLIWGLIMSLLFAWVIGLIQLGIVLLIIGLFFIFMYTMGDL
jgi:hypothetical protein